MWTKGSAVLDASVGTLGLELPGDAVVLGTASMLLLFLAPPWLWLGGTGLLWRQIVRSKRGQPAGAIVHWLHTMFGGMLPGLLPPQARTYSPWGA
jgi:hypothetical protein